jgi:hypothetical protein
MHLKIISYLLYLYYHIHVTGIISGDSGNAKYNSYSWNIYYSIYQKNREQNELS